MAGSTEQGNVVKEFSIGNTHVMICDDYCRDRTSGEIDRIMRRIALNALEQLSATAAASYNVPVETNP